MSKIHCGQAARNSPGIRAELTDRGEVLGVIATGNASALALCRELAQGIDPDWALVVYRAGKLAVWARSIGPPPSHPPSPMRKKEPPLVGDRLDALLDAARTEEWTDWPATEAAS
jgi:hypothetical protein